jgi:hypothetical protein
LSIVEGLNWKPKKPETKHHEFIEDLILGLLLLNEFWVQRNVIDLINIGKVDDA